MKENQLKCIKQAKYNIISEQMKDGKLCGY